MPTQKLYTSRRKIGKHMALQTLCRQRSHSSMDKHYVEEVIDLIETIGLNRYFVVPLMGMRLIKVNFFLKVDNASWERDCVLKRME